MKIKLFLFLFLSIAMACVAAAANPVAGMLERIDPGASKKFVTEVKASPDGADYFEISQKGKRIRVAGNNYVSVAPGINWYLKHVAGVHLSWNGMTAKLPDVLPPVKEKIRKGTDMKLRYDFNYCTYSYTMPFWSWERWEQEIDWMALHGINMPLAAIGQECVWKNMLTKLGYSKEEINNFISGPGFLAWWAMNNLERVRNLPRAPRLLRNDAQQCRHQARTRHHQVAPVERLHPSGFPLPYRPEICRTGLIIL